VSKTSRFLALGSLTAFLLTGCGSVRMHRLTRTERHMGTQVRISVEMRTEATQAAAAAIQDAFARIRELDGKLSDYAPASELNRLSAAPAGQPYPVSTDLFDIMKKALDIARASQGSFDPTVGPLVKLWRRARRTGRRPDRHRLGEARRRVGFDKVTLDPTHHTVTLAVDGMALDLGGIAKGYAAQEALNVLRRRGFPNALVDAGGDVVVGDAPSGRAGWRVGLAAPGREDRPVEEGVEVVRKAVATSGDAFQFVVIDGKRYSHILDPRTGEPLTHSMSVTVIARDGALADALASALAVLGAEEGFSLLARYPGTQARIVVEENGSWRRSETPGFHLVLKRKASSRDAPPAPRDEDRTRSVPE